MPEKSAQEASDSIVESPQISLLREAIPEYWTASSALHHVQSIVARKLENAFESCEENITAALGKPGDVVRSICPDFPADDFDYQSAQICASVWLESPLSATLWLYLSCSKPEKDNVKTDFAVALEVQQQYRRNEFEEKLRNCQGYFSEEWDGYAVGLSRPLVSSDTIEEEASTLLKEFMTYLKT